MDLRDNTIYIIGGTYNLLINALQQWIDAYNNHLNPDLVFQINPASENQHIIIADKQLDNEMFFFLVNYITFPENIDYNINLKAYTTLKNNFTNEFTGKQVMIFINEKDKDYDNVYAVTKDNKILKIDFGGKTTEINDDSIKYESPDFAISDSKHSKIIKPTKTKTSYLFEENKELSASKRFKIVSIIYILLSIITLFFLNKIDDFYFYNTMLFMMANMWFYIDYELLQHSIVYKKALLFSTGILLYGFLLYLTYAGHDTQRLKPLILYTALFSFIFLLYQKPLRLKFIKLTGKEPVIDRSHTGIDSFFYGIVLLSLTTATICLMSFIIT